MPDSINIQFPTHVFLAFYLLATCCFQWLYLHKSFNHSSLITTAITFDFPLQPFYAKAESKTNPDRKSRAFQILRDYYECHAVEID